MEKSNEKKKLIPKCTKCGSDNTKKKFLGIPDVFGCGPVLVGGLALIAGIIVIISGLAEAKPLSEDGPHDWLVKIIAGLLIVVLMIIGLIAKNHKCLDCNKSYFWPPSIHKLKLSCPQCGTSLKGVDSDMVGEIAICTKCEYEFEITDES